MMQLTNRSIHLASLTALLIVAVSMLAKTSFGQCCLGAQDSVTHSHGGRFRVEAESLTGTGPANHGPYKFRFRTVRETVDGEDEVLGEFERAWDTRNHFNMTVCVSPTGNGFALSSSLEEPIHFFAPDGTILASIDEYESQSISWVREDHSSLEHTLFGYTRFGHRSTRIWLPLFHITGPETKWVSRQEPSVVVETDLGFKTIAEDDIRWLVRMLKWQPEQGKRDIAKVRELIAESDEQGLVDLGLSALPAIDARLVMTEHPDLRRVQREIVRRLCGHREAWRNLDLLAALLEHPNVSLQDCAREQLQTLIPDGEPNSEWITSHRQQLRWDSERNIYHR